MSHTFTSTAVLGYLKWDTFERAGWTGVQTSLGVLAADLADVPAWWAAPIALALASAKSYAASRLGVRGTGSTLPAGRDPAGAEPLLPTPGTGGPEAL
ncbi:hypothetical protein [Streptomyces sp. Z26]|uniref:hypothetical protein n=1 Tax=Streptomyces sp. Z26 TaxID=2500177 RepID=UPI000EF15E29|nr:hypothetical protein [Streptomyces sp. Z26]RLL67000.1 hypothetical protein D7M15_09120 [Streptomyces sp. Z26]